MEELILSFLCWFVVHTVFLGLLTIIHQYLLWKRVCKHMLLTASKNYCMCGEKIDSHNAFGNHSPVSEHEWAVENLPKLELG